jgi:two-component system sensor histidine kinase KdpD
MRAAAASAAGRRRGRDAAGYGTRRGRAARQREVIPTQTIDGVPVIDVPVLLKRRPHLCLVDGVAATTAGSRHQKRYQDVEELLMRGIAVLTSINLGTRNSSVRAPSPGRCPSHTVPQDFINRADEVVVVDAPPETDSPMRAHQLSLLRQRPPAHRRRGGSSARGCTQLNCIQSTWEYQERVLVCMTPRANAAAMLCASGRRNADRFHGELFAVYVNQPNLTPEDRSALDRNVMLARAQEARIDIPGQEGPNQAILDYASLRHHATVRRP